MMPFSDEDLQEPVNTIIKNKIAPMLARDGGAIELLDIKDARVFVQLKGACVGCSASSSTLKYIVEKELKAASDELDALNTQLTEGSLYLEDKKTELTNILKMQEEVKSKVEKLESEWFELFDENG